MVGGKDDRTDTAVNRPWCTAWVEAISLVGINYTTWKGISCLGLVDDSFPSRIILGRSGATGLPVATVQAALPFTTESTFREPLN
jgi:hypothetical protein